MRLIVLVLLTAGIGCANSPHDECGGKVLILWPTAAGDFKFQEIGLSTLKSPYELKGSAAEIYFESRMTEQGYEGPVARPNLTRTGGGVCVPTDVSSSMALTTYAHMEHLYKFDQKMKVDNQLSWPRKVGVDIHMRGGDGLSHSNAHYYGGNDTMAVVPYTLGGLPLGLNPGVLGHEHFHAHFQSQVNNPINQTLGSVISLEEFFYAGFGVKPRVEEVEGLPQSPTSINKFVMRSWNEGLADFYGAVFSGTSEYFSASLAKLKLYRDLAGPLEFLMSSQGLIGEASRLDRWHEEPCRRTLMCTSYKQGTLLARLFYRIAYSGSIAPEALLQMVVERLKQIPTASSPIFSRRVLDFEEVVPLLLEGVPLNEGGCDAVKAALSKTLLLRSFAQCGT